MSLPATRGEAIAIGSPHYFTGLACRRGHIEKRRAPGGDCLACDREKQVAIRKANENNPEYQQRRREHGLKSARKRLADPIRRSAIRQREGELQRASPERRAKKAAADKVRNQRPEVKAKTRERAPINQKNYAERWRGNPDKLKARHEYLRKWRDANPDKILSQNSERKFLRLHAIRPFDSVEIRKEIAEFYKEARRLTQLTGIKHVVDHIIPLKGVGCCGLHLPRNLRVITQTENSQKSNKMPPPEQFLAATDFNQDYFSTLG